MNILIALDAPSAGAPSPAEIDITMAFAAAEKAQRGATALPAHPRTFSLTYPKTESFDAGDATWRAVLRIPTRLSVECGCC
jgi:hypothetical protein